VYPHLDFIGSLTFDTNGFKCPNFQNPVSQETLFINPVKNLVSN